MITTADFTGVFAINQGTYGNDKLQGIINDLKDSIIYDLLGTELAELFLDDIEEVSPAVRFTKIKNPFYADDIYGKPYRSAGMVEMLKCFVYFEYTRNSGYEVKSGNLIKNNTELSMQGDGGNGYLQQMYNRGVRTYRAIQQYIEDNNETYPEYSGIDKSLILF
jgi:hypothetical protein